MPKVKRMKKNATACECSPRNSTKNAYVPYGAYTGIEKGKFVERCLKCDKMLTYEYLTK